MVSEHINIAELLLTNFIKIVFFFFFFFVIFVGSVRILDALMQDNQKFTVYYMFKWSEICFCFRDYGVGKNLLMSFQNLKPGYFAKRYMWNLSFIKIFIRNVQF
jgi:hypothetical protein